MSSSKPLTSQSVETHHLTNSRPRASKITTMLWRAVERQLPGAHRTQPFSIFAGLEKPAIAKLVSCNPDHLPPGKSPKTILLDGRWERCIDPDQATTRSVAFAMPSTKTTWEPTKVPQNYGLEPDLQFYFGPLWYRRTITRPAEALWVDLHFEAVDYLADVVLNGEYLGRHEGYFAPFAFDLSEKLAEGEQAELIVRVQDPLENLKDKDFFTKHRKRWIKGTMNYHDSRPGGMPGSLTPGWTSELGQSRPTGGIIGSVTLRVTGPARLDGIFVTPLELSGKVHLALAIFNRVDSSLLATVAVEITAPDGIILVATLELVLAPGTNRIDLESHIPDPQLWYDASSFEIGSPNLYTVQAIILVEDSISSAIKTTFGFRFAEIRTEPKWAYRLNGEDIFIRAANYIPIQHWAGIGAEFYKQDFSLLQQANLHSVGIHAHVQSPACYEAADRMGISVFQDFPLQWSYASGTQEYPEFIPKATAMAAEMAYLLWNHPSVVNYTVHNEPLDIVADLINQSFHSDLNDRETGLLKRLKLRSSLFLLNRFFLNPPDKDKAPPLDRCNYWLDAQLKKTLENVDPIRFTHRRSGTGYDTHEYSGTIHGGSVYDVGHTRAPFVSEYGSWSVNRTAVPHSDHWAKPWPPEGKRFGIFCHEGLIWTETVEMAGHFKRYPNLAAFAYATERKAAFVAKYQTEFFRINRGRPYTGYRWHFFVNHWCRSGAGLLDVDRVPTMAYHALAQASRPRLVATSLDHTIFSPRKLTFPIYGINDRRSSWQVTIHWRLEKLKACEVIRTEAFRGGPLSLRRHVSGTYALPLLPDILEVADSGELFGTVPTNETIYLGAVTANLERMGAFRLVMTWDSPDGIEENDYTVLIVPEGWKADYGLQAIYTEGITQNLLTGTRDGDIEPRE